MDWNSDHTGEGVDGREVCCTTPQPEPVHNYRCQTPSHGAEGPRLGGQLLGYLRLNGNLPLKCDGAVCYWVAPTCTIGRDVQVQTEANGSTFDSERGVPSSFGTCLVPFIEKVKCDLQRRNSYHPVIAEHEMKSGFGAKRQ